MRGIQVFRAAVWGLAAGCLAVIVYFTVVEPRTDLDIRSTPATAITDAASIGGPFSMTEHTGETVTEATYAGKAWLVFMGFTHCPTSARPRLRR